MTRRRLWLSFVITALLCYRVGLAYYAFWGPAARPHRSLSAAILELAVLVWVPLLCLAAAAFVGLSRPGDPRALKATFMFASLALVFGPDAELLPRGFRAVAVGVESLAGAVALPLGVLLFFFAYPNRSEIDRRLPWLKWALPCVGLVMLSVLMLREGAAGGPDTRAPILEVALLVWIGAHYPLAMAALGMSMGRARAPDETRRLRLLFLGTCAGTLPLLAIVVAQRAGIEPPPVLLGLLVLTIGLFPLSFVYVVVKHRVFGIRPILRRGLQYALVSRGFPVVGGLLIFALLHPLASDLVGRAAPDAPQTATLVSAALTLGLVALNRRISPAIDRRFFREAYDARVLLLELGRAVRRLASRPAELLDTVKRRIHESLHPRFVTVQLNDPRWGALAPDYDTPLVADAGGGPHLLVARAAIQAALMVARVAAQAGDPEPRPVSFRVPGHGRDDQGGEGLLVPIAGSGGTLGFLVLGEKLSEEPYSGEDKELLQTVAEQTAVALENAQLFQQVAEQERLRREVEIAREVQGQLFPQVFPPLATLRYCGSCRPARAVGGDYYDFIALGQSRLGVALGDIAGKGISAALLMTSLHAMLRSHALLGSDDLPTLVSGINRLLYASTDAARYATFFYGVYEADSRRLRYVNAGHIPPILVRPEDAPGTFHRLCEGGPVIGLLPDPTYEPGSVALRPGDVLVIVSDGVSEAENAAGDMFGEDRIAQIVAAHMHEGEGEIHERLLEEVTRFRDGTPQGDDMTLVVAKVS